MSKETKLTPELRFPEFEKDGVWVEKMLDNVATFLKGKGISKADIVENGNLPCIRYGELYTQYNETISEIKSRTNVDSVNLVLSQENDVIIPASGETQVDIATAACVLNGGIALGGDLNIIRTELNGVFLAYYLNNAKKRDIAQMAQGVSVIHLYPSQLKTLMIAIPSFQEQQKIASFLSSLDELIAAHTDKLQALKEHKKGLMQNLFPQEGETVPKVRFPEFEQDGEWMENKLKNLGGFLGGGTPLKSNPEYWFGGIPWISSSDIFEDDIWNISITRFINEEAIKQSATKIIPKGSVLFVSRVGVGKLAINECELCTSQDFTSFVSESVNNYFIGYYFSANKQLLQAMNQGTSIKGFSKSDLENFILPCPQNSKEQQKIASILSAVDKLITAQTEKIEQLQQHKKGLMQGLFPKIEG